jgi:hypothetical protein
MPPVPAPMPTSPISFHMSDLNYARFEKFLPSSLKTVLPIRYKVQTVSTDCRLAQSVEQVTVNHWVVGSSPTAAATFLREIPPLSGIF